MSILFQPTIKAALYWDFVPRVNESRKLIQSLFCMSVFLILGTEAWAQSEQRPARLLEKIVTLRFGNEQVITTRDGNVDLTHLGSDEWFRVAGLVPFYPDTFLDPEVIRDHLKNQTPLPTPAAWVPMNQTVFPRKIHTALSQSGTFILRFQFSERTQLEFKLRQKMHPYRMYIIDQNRVNLVDSIGNIDKPIGPEGLISDYRAPMVRAEVDGNFVVLIQAAASNLANQNFVNIQEIFVARLDQLYPTLHTSYFALGTIGGGLLVIALFYAFIYMFRTQDRSSLFLSLYSLFSAYLAFHYFFGTYFSSGISTEFFSLSNHLAIGCLMAYMLTRIGRYIRRSIAHNLAIGIVVVIAGDFVFSVLQMAAIVSIFFLMTYVVAFSLMALTLIVSVRHKLNGTLYLITGALLNSIFQFVVIHNLILEINADFGLAAVFGNLSMAICLALVNAKDFAVTYRKAVEHDKLNQKLLTDLEEQEKARTIFFHNTSHELRTPLNGIIGFLDLVRQGRYGSVSTAATQQISKALRLAEGLKIQVNTILDLAKSKRGELSLRPHQFSLDELKVEADNLSEGLTMKSSGLSYNSSLTCETSDFIGDRDKIYTVIRNLLGNAFKFRAPDRPNAVALYLQADSEGLSIEVSDTGIGIPEHFRDKIFEEFGQVQGDARRAYEGTGLGLSMVRDLIKLMQGELTFDSIVGQGTTFRIRIPRMSESALVSSIPDRKDQVREVHVGAAVPAQDVSSPPVTLQKAGEGWEVFVIDDNEINCEVITEILKNDGYNLDHAVSGRAGLEQMRKKRPHLLLLDMMMPEMSGEDVIKAMREDPLLQEIPVILITARASEEDRILGLKLGADDYLPKPIFAEELRLRVRNMSERHRLLRLVERSAQEDKMIQLGELFSDLTHELKNIIQGSTSIEDITAEDSRLALAPINLSDDIKMYTAKALVSDLALTGLNERRRLLDIDRSDPLFRLKNRIKQNLIELDLNDQQLGEIWGRMKSLDQQDLARLESLLKIFSQYRILFSQMKRSQDLSSNVLNFTRTEHETIGYTTLTESWNQCMGLVGVRLRKRAFQLDAIIPELSVMIKPRALTQVFVNLVFNAYEAMSSQNIEEAWIRVRVEREPKNVIISIENAGSPIPIHVQERLFQRGFSTKGEKGNGIGLYSSRRILKEVGGDLVYDSERGHPCFRLTLPLPTESLTMRAI